jgi:GT2 family glycosyltransferase
MIPVLGVPILNRGDLLLRLFHSIDYPVDTLHVVINYTGNIPDNSVTEAVTLIRDAINADHPFVKHLTSEGGMLYNSKKRVVSNNLGVAGSWNHLIKSHPEASFIMLVGNDIQFSPGDLEKFDTFMSGLTTEQRNTKGITCGNHGYSCFAVLPETITNVGYFDENIYPAYLEDCDYSWRCKLASVHNNDVPDTHMIHGEAPNWGSSTIYSNNDYRNKNGVTHGRNFEYYRKKWGGNNGEEKFRIPFNDPTMRIQQWNAPERILAW